MYKILVVDDEKLICNGIKHKISRIENSEISDVFIAYEGSEAIKLALEVRPEIIITDMMMPDINGVSLIGKISRQLPDTKFIVLSGYNDFEFVKPAFKLGIVDYILKPVRIEKLKDVLNTAKKILKKQEFQKENLQENIYKIIICYRVNTSIN